MSALLVPLLLIASTLVIKGRGFAEFGRGGRRCVDWETLIALAFPIWPLIGVDWGKCQSTFLCLRPGMGYYEPWQIFKIEDHWTRRICGALVLLKLPGSPCEFNILYLFRNLLMAK